MLAAKLIIGIVLLSAAWFPQGGHSAKTSLSALIDTQAEPVSAQQDADKKASPSTEPVDRALDVIAYVATLVPSLLRLESQVSAYAALADTLWRYDQGRAREYFRSAFGALAKVDVTTKPKDRQTARVQEQLKQWKRETRTQLLNRIAQLDADLAKELASKVGEKEGKNAPADETALNSESIGLLFQRAYELLNTDPEQAAALAQQTLAAGVSPWLIEFLSALRERAPALADRLFESALNVILAQSNPPDISVLHLLGAYVLESPGGANASLTQRFLSLVAVALQAQSDPGAPFSRRLSPGEQRYIVQLYLPLFERYAPELVPAMQAMLDHLNANLPPKQSEPSQPGPTSSPNQQGGGLTPGAGQEPQVSRGDVGKTGDLMSPEGDEGKASATEGIIMKLPDEKVRQALLDTRRYNSAQSALEQDKIDEAYRLTQQIKDPLKQIDLFVELGRKLADRGEPERAVAFLDKALPLVSALSNLREGALQALMLTRSALAVNRDRALHYAQSAVTILNRLQSSASADTDPMRELARRQGLRGQLEAIFVPLGRVDFEQAIYLAMQLQDTEQRVLAEIAACRSVLERPEKKAKETEGRGSKIEDR
ncbi:MAG: hypothetical protein HY314_06645 [Acidobacteria bacterium]|nr:hypothetical protein [Acidobacteriota bacterium]